MSAFYRLKPKIDILEKIQSGGNKPDWIEARFNLTKQMEIMLGNLTLQEIMTDNEGNLTDGPPPPWYDPNNLPIISRNMIAWWDECHIEQQGGKVGNRPFQYSFKRDSNGKLSDNGEYQSKLLTKTSFKFPEQARFSFGFATVKRNGTREGICLPPINYTNQNIITIETYEKHMKEEMTRVKSLNGCKN